MLPEVSGHSGTAEGASVELCSASKNGAPPPALRPQLCPGTRMAPGSGSLRLAAEQARTDPDWLSFPHPGATESRDPRGVSTRRMRGGKGGGTRARRRLGDDTHQRYAQGVRGPPRALSDRAPLASQPPTCLTCPLNPFIRPRALGGFTPVGPTESVLSTGICEQRTFRKFRRKNRPNPERWYKGQNGNLGRKFG